MFSELKISNFKSITDLEIDLGRFNVFIGENGCGKTNVLEAVALLSASKNNQLDPLNLDGKGIRVTKPTLTSSSFTAIKQKKTIDISIKNEREISCSLVNNDKENIYSEWEDLVYKTQKKTVENYLINHFSSPSFSKYLNETIGDTFLANEEYQNIVCAQIDFALDKTLKEINDSYLKDYLIYSINSTALRGLFNTSKVTPLGVFGEGLDVLINNFNKEEKAKINRLLDVIPWFNELIVDGDKTLKNQGHNLGRSTSSLYFTDKFMKRNNKTFAAENANEGVLFLLFYFSLFISEKTPKFFAIDNIDTALNPKLCRDLIKELVKLAKDNNKQTLVTTHNPAILDGLNLHDDEQRLFVVKRTDDGYTKVERIKIKPKAENSESKKLSELWMSGYLGGLPSKGF
jgi:predicted ATPase